jgi:acyl carrier protein
MISEESVMKTVYAAIDDFNDSVEEDEKIEKAAATILFGKGAVLDSLGFVNLIVAIENRVDDDFDQLITIVDQEAMESGDNPFETVDSLVKYLTKKLEAENA